MRLIIVEKPSCVRILAAAAQEAWPNEELIFLAAITITMTTPRLPRGLPYSSYPIIAEPSFKPNGHRFDDAAFCRIYRVNAQTAELPISLSANQTSELIKSADRIICMPDYDYSGTWGMYQLFRMFRPDLCVEEIDIIRLTGGYTEKHCTLAVKNLIKTSCPEYQHLLNAGRVKSYFDYNFTINSIPIFGNLYRSLLGSSAPVFISKYAIQTIIYLSENDGLTEQALLSRLEGDKWLGSGRNCRQKYKFLDGIGSPASRTEIQMQLIKIGLLKQTGRNLFLTEAGQKFVSKLHKDTKDYDLPFRLDEWMKMSFDQAKPKMDTYLKTFFGKQQRFQKI